MKVHVLNERAHAHSEAAYLHLVGSAERDVASGKVTVCGLDRNHKTLRKAAGQDLWYFQFLHYSAFCFYCHLPFSSGLACHYLLSSLIPSTNTTHLNVCTHTDKIYWKLSETLPKTQENLGFLLCFFSFFSLNTDKSTMKAWHCCMQLLWHTLLSS